MRLSPSTDDSFTSPVIVAYLILAHGNPKQLKRLVGTLPTSSPIFIHFDSRADRSLYEQSVTLLGGRPNLHFVKRHRCRWGAIGIVEGTMSLIDAATTSAVPFDYAMLLSGSDYPIKSNQEISLFLRHNWGHEFIESELLTESNRWSNHGGNYKTPEKVLSRHLRFRSRIFRLPGLRTLPAGLKPYGGSQWWCLTSGALMLISQFVRENADLMKFFRYTFIPDESFIQTILSNSKLQGQITGDEIRLVVWDRPDPPYPATLKIEDLELILSSKKLFGRKFDSSKDAAILDALDERNASPIPSH
jgi:hypothetical protein